MTSLVRLAILLMWGVLVLPSQALADTEAVELESDDPEERAADADALMEARLVYEQAVTAYEAKEYERAIELFKRADQLKPNAAFSFNIGIAYQDMGNAPMALRYYRDYLRQAPDATDRADVLARIRSLEYRLRRQGVQQVTVITNPPNAAVSIDGQAVGLSPWTGEFTPGNHEVTAKLAGHEVTQRVFDLPPDHAVDVTITLLQEQAQKPVRKEKEAKPKGPPPEPSWYEDVRPVTWGVLGVGVGSLVVAGLSELSRDAARDELRQPSLSDQERDELREMAASRRVRADSFMLLGLGMCVTGGVLIYSDMVEADSHRRALYAGCTGEGCSFRLEGVF